MSKQELNFIVCPDCEGDGYVGNKRCQRCHGVGIALYLPEEEKVLYWGLDYDPAHIAFEKITKTLKIIINLMLGFFGLSGILVLIYFAYLVDFKNLIDWQYWLTPSFDKLYFWISLLVDLYLYYRLEQEASPAKKVLVKGFSKGEQFALLDWQTIWQMKKNQKIDISLAFTEKSKKAIQASYDLAKIFKHSQVERIHLFGVMSQFDSSAVILARLGIDFDKLKQKLTNYFNKPTWQRSDLPILSTDFHKLLLLAYYEAYVMNNEKVDLQELIFALANPEKMNDSEKDILGDILIDFENDYQKFRNVVEWIRIQQKLRQSIQRFKSRARYKPKSGLDRAMTAVATPVLDQFSEDLTLMARNGHLFPCIGREKEIEQIFRIMEGSREGVLLVGNQGVGRTTLIHGLAQRMVEENVPEILQDKRLISLDVARLLAGANPAAAEQRLIALADEIIRAGNIVLAIENLHDLTGITAGTESSLDLTEVFAQILKRNLFYTIATTTPKEYAKVIENRTIDADFQVIKVDELEMNDAILVLEAQSGQIEYSNKVYFSYKAIEQSVELSNRYIHDRYLPEKALEILEQAAIKVAKEQGEKNIVTDGVVAEVVSNLTNIPLTKLTEKESQKLLNLEEKIHERMVGQEEAVNLVASSLRRARAELKDEKRPIATLLFLGPTGVGKTELAKTVADVYFGNENAMIRVDMSEFQDKASLNRLIGNQSNTGLLSEPVRKNPFSLVLIDEVEKAHPDILNLFLQILDDGRLTDGTGRIIDFSNTIIIMTSNAGANYIQDSLKQGLNIEQIKQELINNKLKDYYRPEFLNRFDGIVVFKTLSMSEVRQIAELLIAKIVKKLVDKGIDFSVSPEAVDELAELGYDPKFGARPLRRVIQTRIDDVLANHLLKGDIGRRDKVILLPEGKLDIVKAEQL